MRKPHGLHGEMVVEVFSDEPSAVFAPGRVLWEGTHEATPSGRDHEVVRARPFKDAWLLTLRGVGDRSAAESLRGVYLLASFSELPAPVDGEFWIHELVGMAVIRADGAPIGTVGDVVRLPHGHLLEITTANGTASIPFVDAIVISVDRITRVVTIDPPDGLLDL